MSKVLVVHDGKRERELLLVERLVVGRDPMCDLSHDDALLSRRHAEFATAGDEVTVRDLGSRNGLFVNGSRTAERALRPGDIVTIGPLRVRYVVSDAPLSLAPDELDIGSTRVIPATVPKAAPRLTTPLVPVADAEPEPDIDDEDEENDPGEDEVTRVVQASELAPATGTGNDDEFDEAEATMLVSASSVTPASNAGGESASGAVSTGTLLLATPAAPARPSADAMLREPVAARAAAPTRAPESPAPVPFAEPVVIHAGALTGFVFVLLAALASVVFIASAAPLILWRGDEAQAPGMASLLRWPVLPIIIAMATTYVVATIVNRRVLDTLMALQQGAESAAPPGDFPRG